MTNLTKSILTVLVLLFLPATYANSFSFDTTELVVDSQGQATLSVVYDFTELAMYYGGFDLSFDSQSLEIASIEFFPPDNVYFGGSFSQGELVGPGFYSNVSFYTKYFGGFSGTAVLATFVFNVDEQSPLSTASECAENVFICMLPTPNAPFVGINGQDVTEDIFANSVTGLIIPGTPVPLPATIWLLLGSVGALVTWTRKQI